MTRKNFCRRISFSGLILFAEGDAIEWRDLGRSGLILMEPGVECKSPMGHPPPPSPFHFDSPVTGI